MSETITRTKVLRLALPLIVANATTPLLGLVDTAVLGHGGSAVDLAAISLGVLVFNFIYWGFGFLRMTTTGFVAQAQGARDQEELVAATARPILMGLMAGTLLLVAQSWISSFAFGLLSAGQEEEVAAQSYVAARIGGAPGALAALGAMGMLIGLGKTKQFLFVQLITNGLNMALDVLFVSVFAWGVRGVGVGTAISEWTGAVLALSIVSSHLRGQGATISWRRVFDGEGVKRTLKANSDIMLRTLLMISGFAFFTDQGARLGTEILAANHLLGQLITLSAFFLDGYAHVAESLVGAAKGARDMPRFRTALRTTSEVAAISAVVLAIAVLFGGPLAIALLTDLPAIRALAEAYLLPVASYVALSVAAFQLDGVFIGATETRMMRNTSAISLTVFISLALLLVPQAGNSGLWWAFVAYVAVRGLSLFILLPKLRQGIAPPSSAAS